MSEMTHHPLLFTLRDAVSGKGFLAGITLSGRALMVQEDGKWWTYGVRPGAIAESGSTPQESFARFRNRYKEVLFDIADESRTFAAFKREVERFANEVDKEEERSWNDALQLVRASSGPPPEPFSQLDRMKAEEAPPKVTVEKLSAAKRKFTPKDNLKDTVAKAA
ncbi:MAG TPA: hypothetical protein VN682_11170 [Terriglobales bacterium]|jgi:hypothetical protein|nr:hypothetical protein [Terriglobales bacterium]